MTKEQLSNMAYEAYNSLGMNPPHYHWMDGFVAGYVAHQQNLQQTHVMCWREISKEMPPEHESVLVRLDGDTYLIGVMDSNNEWGIYWADGINAEDPERPVTHWMPIPACT